MYMIKQFSAPPVGRHLLRPSATLALLVLCGLSTATADTLCVNAAPRSGCFATIQAAVNGASANDTIRVVPGTYKEDVIIGKPLSIVGVNNQTTIVDATGLSNGFNVDGIDNPGLAAVSISGFTVQNANAQGIVVTNATDVTISNNIVQNNDRNLQLNPNGPPSCPGLPPYFQAGESFDCGEGIHLSGADHSIVTGNVVQNNSGGILISDDTAPNHDNVISNNLVQNNPYDCSITLASHHFSMQLDPNWGVFHNTVTGNTSTGNGLATGEGAGVGLFAAAPGGATFGNRVVNNVLTNNGLPGVAMHSHTAPQNLNDNVIVGNQISGNGPDPDPNTMLPTGIVVFSDDTGGAPPITGTVISGNTIKNEGIDIAVKTPGNVVIHFNNLLDPIGVDNLGSGSANATQNWWKCPGGPSATNCGTAVGPNIQFTPWLVTPYTN
jgi:parallel beta-helix repeat protein